MMGSAELAGLWAQTGIGSSASTSTAVWLVMLLGLVAVGFGAWLLGARQLSSARAAGGAVSLIGLALIAFTSRGLPQAQLILVAMLLLATGLYCVVGARGSGRLAGWLAVITSFLLFAGQIGSPWTQQLLQLEGVTFWILGTILLAAALGTISSRDPIYSAIWFALTLLCTGALMMLQGAQFLGIATVAVYAGAIVVTFLFVLMLAQPEGRSFYDRTSWGRFPTMLAAGSAALVTGLVVMALIPGVPLVSGDPRIDAGVLGRIDATLAELQASSPSDRVAGGVAAGEGVSAGTAGTDNGSAESSQSAEQGETAPASPAWQRRQVRVVAGRGQPTLRVTLAGLEGAALSETQRGEWTDALTRAMSGFAAPPELGGGAWHVELSDNDLRRTDHVAVLGRNLFGRHLVAVELAGVLLFIALVGAVAMSTIEPQPITGYAGRN